MNDTVSSASETSPVQPLAADGSSEVAQALRPLRTSELLRGILTKNPGVKHFSVQRILSAIGHDRPEASLVLFSIPNMLPVPGTWGFAKTQTRRVGAQLLTGKTRVELPRQILRKSVSRKVLAVAIHAILPAIEAAERVARPRWSWLTRPSARRAIGLLVFLLALAIGFPLLGFNALHATSIFVMALGLAEQDGLAVLLGVAVGLSSLLLAGSGISVRKLRSKGSKWLRKLSRKLGMKACVKFLKAHGYERLARFLALQWSDLLLLWDPESAASRAARAAGAGAHAESPAALVLAGAFRAA